MRSADESIPVSDHEAYDRLEGEVLHAEREDLATLEAIRDQIGPYNFASQYQQRPETPEGSLIKRKYIQVIDPPHPIRPGGLHWVSIDSAQSTSETADYSSDQLSGIPTAMATMFLLPSAAVGITKRF